jgi:hypothetical protein
VITSPAEGSMVPSQSQPLVVSGTGGLPSAAQTVTIDVSYWTGTAFAPLCSTDVSAAGWSCAATVALPPGAHSIAASQLIVGWTATQGAAVGFAVVPPPVEPPVTPVVPPVTPVEPPVVPRVVDPPSPPAPPATASPSPAPPTVVAPTTPIAPTERPGDENPEPEEVTASSDTLEASQAAPRNAPGAPSALTGSLTRPGIVAESPMIAIASTAAALVLTLVVIIPAELVGSAFTEESGFFARLWKRRTRLHSVSRGVRQWVDRHRVIAGMLATVATAVVFAQVDPNFGLDLASARLVLSCAIALLVIGYFATALSGRISQAFWSTSVRVTVHPFGVLVAVIGVAASRILDFAPGFLLGAVLGMAIAGAASTRIVAHVMLVRSTVLLTVSLAAWVGSIAVVPGDPADTGSFWVALASDALVATTTGGLTALLVGLLPFSPLEGEPVFQHSKVLWAGSYVAAVTAFCVVVLPRADNWLDVGDGVVTWVVIATLFVLACAALFVIFYLRSRRNPKAMPARSRAGMEDRRPRP